MKKEHELLLKLCSEEDDVTIDLSHEEISKLNWSEILYNAVTHRIDCYIANKKINGKYIRKYNLQVGKCLLNQYTISKYVSEFWQKEFLIKIMPKIAEKNHDLVLIKGLSIALTLYKDPAQRRFGDIDILFNKKDLKRTKLILEEIGLLQADIDIQSMEIKPAEKRIVKFFEMTTHQTSPFLILTEDSICSSISVDANFGLSSVGNIPNRELVSELIKSKVSFKYNDDVNVNFLSKEGTLIQFCINIYRDSTVLLHIKDRSDIQIYKYIDIKKIIKEPSLDLEYVAKVVKKYKIEEPIYYSLLNCSMLFPEIKETISEFMELIEPDNISNLDKFGIENEKCGIWDISFIDRVFHPDRFSILEDKITSEELSSVSKREVLLNSI